MNPTHLALAALLILVWGFNFVIIRLGLDGLPPIFLAFARFFLTCIPAVFFIKRPRVPLLKVFYYGLTIFALQFAFFFLGMDRGVPPGLAAILMQTHVFFSFLLAILFFKERIGTPHIAGAIVSFSGIGLAAFHLGGEMTASGFILVILAAASWGAGSAISKTLKGVNMASLVVWGSAAACPVLGLLSLFIEGPSRISESLTHISWITAGAVCYLTYLSTFFGYGLWSWLLDRHPLSTVAPFTLLTPIVAMLSSWAVLGEPLEGWKMIAAILVIGGLCIHLFLPRKVPKDVV